MGGPGRLAGWEPDSGGTGSVKTASLEATVA